MSDGDTAVDADIQRAFLLGQTAGAVAAAQSKQPDKSAYMLFRWFLSLYFVVFFIVFGIEYFFDAGRYTKFFTFTFFFNIIILTYHLERRERTINKDGGWSWARSSKEDDTKFIFAFGSSKVAALSAANISFVYYFAVFKLANNAIRSVWDENVSVLGGLGPEIADLFTLVNLAVIITCIIYASCWQQYIRTRHLPSTDHRC